MTAASAPAPDDRALVTSAQGGDAQALDLLLRRHLDRIHALCRRLCGNDVDAADASQEALIAIVRGLARYDGRAAFTTWAYRVTTNACLDELRRRGRRPSLGSTEDWANPGPQAAARRHGADAPELADAVADRTDIDAALETLPLDFRAAVVLRDLCGLDYAEIAETLSIPIGTVRSRIARGRAIVAERLPGNFGAPEQRRTP